MRPGAPRSLGVDLPLGLPRAMSTRHVAEPDFPSFLRALAVRPDFFRVCATVEEICANRPFYPARGIAGMTRAAHAAALGLDGPADLHRVCDRATSDRPAGASLFWTLGPNQSGKAALCAWRDLLLPSLAGDRPARLWPFEGDLRALLAPGGVVVAETYPAEAMRHLGLRMARQQAPPIRSRHPRGAASRGVTDLAALPEPDLVTAIADGFGADAAGEDRFDSVLGVLCVLNVLAGSRADDAPDDPVIRRWEGWVLGQRHPQPGG